MKKFFNLERKIAKFIGPFVEKLYNVPMPEESCFDAVEELFMRLDGVEKLLSDARITSVRLVTNPEKIVVKETQRAFLYFTLYGLCVDGVVVNKVFPKELEGEFIKGWQLLQDRYLEEIETYFAPLPVFKVPLYEDEVSGIERLKRLGKDLYGENDPIQVFRSESPFNFYKEDGLYKLSLKMPFVTRDKIHLSKRGDELIIEVGVFKRHVILPKTIASLSPRRARFEGDNLVISFEEGENAI